MATFKRALFFSFAGKYTSLFIDFISVMVISRILTPGDIGIYSLAAASIVIGQLLRDFGLSLYIIQEKELTTSKIQSCFTISLILCWTIALGYYFSSSFIASYFNDESISVLIKILTINFFLIPFGTFTLSLLKRDMLFDKLMVIDVASTILRVAALLTMAFLDWGVISMAIASVAGTATTVIMTIPHTSWNNYRFNFKNIIEITKFSSLVSGAYIIEKLQETSSDFIIAKQLSPEHLAFFSKAAATCNLFSTLIMSAFTPVLQPYISSLNRSDNSQLSKKICSIMNILTSISWPFYILIYLLAEEIIFTLYGDQWANSVEIVRIYALFQICNSALPLAERILHVCQDVKFIFNLIVFQFIIRVALVLIFVKMGLYVLVCSFFVLAIIRFLFLAPRLFFKMKVPWKDIAKVHLINLLILAGVFLSASFAQYLLADNLSHILTIIYVSIAALVGWVATLALLKHEALFLLTDEIKKITQKIKKA